MTNVTEVDVVRALDGDRDALTRLVQRVHQPVFRLALRFFGNRADAEDASQEALIQIVTRLDRFSRRPAWASRRHLTWTLSCWRRSCASGARWQCCCASTRRTGWRTSSARSWALTTAPARRSSTSRQRPSASACSVPATASSGSCRGAAGCSILRTRAAVTGAYRWRSSWGVSTRASWCWRARSSRHGASRRSSTRSCWLDEAERAGALYRAHPEAHPKADLARFVRRLFPE